MPIIVPTEQTVTEQPLALPGAQRVDTSGVDVAARAVGQVAGAVTDVAVLQQRRRNATKLFEAEVALDDALRGAQTTARQRKGSEAFGVTQDMTSWWETEPSKIAANLENETQRELFTQSAGRRRSASLDAFSEYESREMNTGLNTAADAAIDTAIDMAATGFDNEATRVEARDILLKRVTAKAALNGYPVDGPVAQAMRMEATTKLHQQVIENMVDVDPTKAREYFDAHKSEIAGSVWDTMNTKISTAKDIVTAQKTADDIWSRGLPRDEALTAARKETEGQTREATLVLLRQQYAERDQTVKEYQKTRTDQAWAAYNSGGMAGLSPSLVADMQSFSPETLEAMRVRQWTPQDRVPTDWTEFDKLKDMATADKAAFGDTDLRQYHGKLNSRELTVLETMQKDINEKRISPTATLTQMLGEVAWDKDARERKGLFDRKVREDVAVEQFRQGRELRDDEVRQVIDRNLMEVTIPRSYWFDKTVPLFEATADQRAAAIVEIESIPAADRKQIEAALTAHGQPVTPDNIVRLFRAVNGIQ